MMKMIDVAGGCNFTMPKRKLWNCLSRLTVCASCNFTMPKRKRNLEPCAVVKMVVATLPCQSGNSIPALSSQAARYGLQLYHVSATILSIPHFFLYCKLNSTYRDTIQFSHTIGAWAQRRDNPTPHRQYEAGNWMSPHPYSLIIHEIVLNVPASLFLNYTRNCEECQIFWWTREKQGTSTILFPTVLRTLKP